MAFNSLRRYIVNSISSQIGDQFMRKAEEFKLAPETQLTRQIDKSLYYLSR